MEDILISKENIQLSLTKFLDKVEQNLNNIDLKQEDLMKLEKLNKLLTEGDGSKVLTDNGEYKEVRIDEINKTVDDINMIYKLFNITTGMTKEKWETKLEMPTSRYFLTSCIYEDKIYCISGYNGNIGGNLTTNECYNVSTNTWETKFNIPTGRYGLTSSIYEDKIYCIGGHNGTYLNKNECYNVNTDTWETKRDMLTSRGGLTSSIYEDKIYCISGFNNNSFSYINECYNISTNTWETKRNIPTARYDLTSCIYENKIYCISGYGNNTSGGYKNECYNVSTNTWETKLNIPTARDNLTSCIYEDKIYVIAGDRGINKNECYNVSTDTWETKLDIPTGRYGLTSCIYENKIYVIGGYNNGNYFSNNDCYNIPCITKSYDVNLPSSIQNKLDVITSSGEGNKILSDDGTYKDMNNIEVEVATKDELDLLLSEINNM